MMLSLLMTYSGVMLLYWHEANLVGADATIGVLLVAAAAFTFSCYVVFSKPYITQFGSRVFTSIAMQAKYFLPVVLNEFRQRYPQVKVNFLQGNPHQLVQMLHDRQADIAVCTEEIAEDEALITHHCYDWNHATADEGFDHN